MKPFLKWAGGKGWLVPVIKKMYEDSSCNLLQELFVGGGSVVFGVMPERAWLNDTCEPLINLYDQIRRGGMDYYRPFLNTEWWYYKTRKNFNDWSDQARRLNDEMDGAIGDEQHVIHLSHLEAINVARARAFYWLNRTGFNGLCRFNSVGGFNVPYGKYKNPTVKIEGLQSYRMILEQCELSKIDFYDVLIRPGAFVYADPPYDSPDEKNAFTTYDGNKFGWLQQEMLAEKLAAHNGPVVASNLATDRVLKLYSDWGFDIHLMNAPRRISANGDRTPAREMVALRNVRWALSQR